MEISKGWWTALGLLVAGAVYKARRPGEMTEQRDRAYRQCLQGLVPVERMRELARDFERARCFPQAAMIRKRIALKELPPAVQQSRREIFKRAMRSTNGPAILRLARLHEDDGATSSAAKLRRRAAELDPLKPQPIVTPAPAVPAQKPAECQTDDTPVLNGKNEKEPSHVAVPAPSAVAN